MKRLICFLVTLAVIEKSSSAPFSSYYDLNLPSSDGHVQLNQNFQNGKKHYSLKLANLFCNLSVLIFSDQKNNEKIVKSLQNYTNHILQVKHRICIS